MKYSFVLFAFIYFTQSFSQSINSSETKILSLEKAIVIATDSSLAAFKAKNLYLSGYWQFKTFKAERLPSLTLDMSPFQCNRNIVKRYDSQNNVDVYKSQQSLNSLASLTLNQNVDLTGGTFYLDSYLGYLRNFGTSNYKQYTSVPFRMGYSQSLFGYNSFKWDKRIEPVHFEKVKKELLYDLQTISEQTSEYFFDLALNQALYNLAKQNLANNDTLYRIGEERYKIGSISQSDLLTLKLNLINSRNDLSDAAMNLKAGSFNLASYLRFEKETTFQLQLPTQPLGIFILADKAIQFAKMNNSTLPEQQINILTARQNLEKTQRESRFSASLSASAGYNQVATDLSGAYRKPLQQDVLSVSLSVPILDWGVRKGKVNMARNNLNVVNITAKQTEQAFEQEVLMAVNEFNERQGRIALAEEARDIAQQAYEKTKQLFLIGKTNVDGVNQALSRRIQAESSYVTSLKSYWLSYYKIRKLTLYDFVNDRTISANYERIEGF